MKNTIGSLGSELVYTFIW